ncbi:MAG: hypothetical protein DYH04_12745 [Nitrospira sp. NTP2]|nr:hypothetical protein [Nitrospira sp. NTP2]QOJ36061.1 MAG: hypothetical protein HRU82_14410 [Nitrospira sp.]RIK60986.1 MAG: hypothetical protein DCC63_02190 [Nitrospira sp.]
MAWCREYATTRPGFQGCAGLLLPVRFYATIPLLMVVFIPVVTDPWMSLGAPAGASVISHSNPVTVNHPTAIIPAFRS